MAESLTHLINPKSQSALTAEESADREHQWWNAVSLEEFTDSDVPPRQILKDRELATVWIIDRSMTTAETSKCRLRRLDEKIAKYGEKWSLSETTAALASDAAAERKVAGDPAELVLDGGFTVPDSNAFGHTFRDYDAESERKKTVEEFYSVNHINQTYEFVQRMRDAYGRLDKTEMSIWECIELLNEFIDDSDPDLDMPQIEHLLQTAEAIRKDYPDEDWLHLTGLIHDLGKVLLHPSFGELPQWAVVGDTFPVGCAFDECNVHSKYFKENPDYHNPEFNTKFGAYSEGCGLDKVLMSWGHDDYMYLVAKENKTTLPSAGLFIIRYHSFYPLHKHGAYTHLMNEEDKENLKWLHVFNKYDLYSKSSIRIDVEEVKPYYMSLIDKYFPGKLRW
ncbi:probable inositol oxygenase isoform X1 [Triticum aestivum]|uniref:probable inositol oxygenase isoform X1 n=1 Tax=Triticum aestivum TaxID=4565 RepID=UPI001D027B23|nr:probable inositol oxygenase isoform X1 [Triticum aestivum]